MQTITFKLDPAIVKEIQKIARDKNSNNSEIIRLAIDFYLGHRSIEGTVRAETAKIESGIASVLKALLVFSESFDEASGMLPIVESQIGRAATEKAISDIRRARAGDQQ